jgi:hypothetical protein
MEEYIKIGIGLLIIIFRKNIMQFNNQIVKGPKAFRPEARKIIFMVIASYLIISGLFNLLY